jgi:protein-disulfide isomerase
MTEETPTGLRSNRRRPAPEADLDVALWPNPAGQAPEAEVPIGTAAPGRQPARAAAPPAGTRPPGMLVPATDPGAAGPPPERPLSAGDDLAEPAVSLTARMSARERIRLERAHRARRHRLIRLTAVGAGVVVLIVAAAAVGILRQHNRVITVKARPEYAGPYAPVSLNADNSVIMAQPGVIKPILDVYEDFQCPVCRTFEQTSGGMIQKLANQGKVKVVYHPFTIFSDEPQQANSIRAWAAAKCAPANQWVRYHNALYASQPAETTIGGFPVSLLVRLGKNARITNLGFAQCVQSQRYAEQNPPFSDQIINGGVNNMLTLKLNGQILNVSLSSSRLRQKILSVP